MTRQDIERSDHGRRHFMEGALLGVAGASMAAISRSVTAADQPSPARRKGLYPGEAPAADSGYSPGISVERGQRMIFVSGQGPEDRTADMETQIRQTFQRIQLVLHESGASFEHVVMLRSYFVHLLRDLPVYRKVRKEFLVEPFPASTAVGVPELAFADLKVEIEAVAIL